MSLFFLFKYHSSMYEEMVNKFLEDILSLSIHNTFLTNQKRQKIEGLPLVHLLSMGDLEQLVYAFSLPRQASP